MIGLLTLALAHPGINPVDVSSFTRVIHLSPREQSALAILSEVGFGPKRSEEDANAQLLAVEQGYKTYPISTPMWKVWALSDLIRRGKKGEAIKLAKNLVRDFGEVSFGWVAGDPELAKVDLGPEWQRLTNRLESRQSEVLATYSLASSGLDHSYTLSKVLSAILQDPSSIASTLEKWNDFPKPKNSNAWFLFHFPFKGQTSGQLSQIPVWVYIPSRYDPKRAHGAIVYSYGGWIRSSFPRPWTMRPAMTENPLSGPINQLDRENLVGIMPQMWNTTSPIDGDGVACFNEVLGYVKSMINIDDDRCSFVGFSDGGTAAFEVMRQDPSSFAAAFPLNGYPWFNLNPNNFANRPIFSYHGQEDSLYPPDSLGEKFKAVAPGFPDWNAALVQKATHDWMFYSDSVIPDAMANLVRMRRDTFRKKLQLEASSKMGTRCDWLEIIQVDQALKQEPWHLDRIVPGEAESGKLPQNLLLNEGSGRVEAEWTGNTCNVRSSRVKTLRIWLHPRLVDLRKPVKVVVNGETKFDGIVQDTQGFALREFMTHFDRKALWRGRLKINL